jgi:hypothetical protein
MAAYTATTEPISVLAWEWTASEHWDFSTGETTTPIGHGIALTKGGARRAARRAIARRRRELRNTLEDE